MRRIAAIVAAFLLGGTLLSPSEAVAGGQTCRGEAATLVGSPDLKVILIGTPERDVVLTNGAQIVDTLAGDDLICVTETRRSYSEITVDSGPGDDIVDSGGVSRGFRVEVELGVGTDVYVGGPSYDTVETGADSDVDTVSTGALADVVRSGQVGQPNGDTIDLGPGDDELVWTGNSQPYEAAILDGGGSRDKLMLNTPAGSNVIDSEAGTFRLNSAPVASWTGFEVLTLSHKSRAAALTLVGGPADEEINVIGPRIVVDAGLGDGDDLLTIQEAPAVASSIAGGGGVDLLYTGTSKGRLKLDMTSGLLSVGRARSAIPTTGFRDAVLYARDVRVIGDHQDNQLALSGCRQRYEGRAGDDYLQTDALSFRYLFYTFYCDSKTLMFGGRGNDDLVGRWGRDRIFGGPGHDRLRGGSGNDLLLGGRGFDRAYGDVGFDRCVAEKENCER